MSNSMRIAVKYCGGCNPRYDRPAIVERLKKDMPGVGIVPAEGQQADYVAVLCGCKSACVQHDRLSGTNGKSVLCGEEDYPQLLGTLCALAAKRVPHET